MTYQCKKVLKNLRLLAGNSETPLMFLGNTSCICIENDYANNYVKTYDYSEYKDEIHGIINQLVSEGCLSADTACSTFSLTQHGLHPYQFQWSAFKSFLFTSILVPIVVSLATTLLTLFVQSLL